MRCGWCESEKLCMPGVASGPFKANCSAWDYAMCSALPCSAHTTCGGCAKDPMCGWCSTSNICTEGSPKGPVFMTCMRKDWMAEEGSCDRLYEAPCPCPEADGVTCKSADKCERNNFINSAVASEDEPPEELASVEWYDSVKPQINVDLIPQPIAEPPAPSPRCRRSRATPCRNRKCPRPATSPCPPPCADRTGARRLLRRGQYTILNTLNE